MSDVSVPTSLPYSKVTHNGQSQAGWVVVWNPPRADSPALYDPIAANKAGIGTVVIRDGLKCPGPTGKPLASFVSIPYKFFVAQAGPRYRLDISNTNPKGPRTWSIDLDKCCGVAFQYFDSGVIQVMVESGYVPVLRT